MKNKFLLFTAVATLAVLPVISLAQTTAASGTIKGQLQAKKEAFKQGVDSMKRAALDNIKERAAQYIQTVKERIDAATGRLSKLADRIDSRITKMAAEKIDVTKAQSLMTDARTKIELARTDNLAIDTSIASSTATSTAALKAEFKTAKDQIAKAKADVRSARAALADVINSLKPGLNKTASSTEN